MLYTLELFLSYAHRLYLWLLPLHGVYHNHYYNCIVRDITGPFEQNLCKYDLWKLINMIFLFVTIQHPVWRTQEIKILIGWNMNKFSHKLSKLNQNFTGKIYRNIFLFLKKKECMFSWPLIMNHNGFWLAEYKKRIFWNSCYPMDLLNSNVVWMIYTES